MKRLALLIAALVAGFILLAITQPGGLSGLALRWFGPPQVELTETHAGDSGEATFDHSAFDRIVAEHVDDEGYVDYAALAADTTALDSYIRALAEAPFDELGRDDKLALLINAYNAFTLRLILDHYPVDSIRDIPDAERWKAVRWKVAGGTWSLDQIEHELVRPNFREPRIHFALVCAAVGCPPLRTEAYTGADLEEQLEDNTIFTHDSPRWVRYRAGAETIELTSLYQWYGGDFEQVAGTVLDYVARYDEALESDLARGHRPEVRFLDYDWSLNTR